MNKNFNNYNFKKNFDALISDSIQSERIERKCNLLNGQIFFIKKHVINSGFINIYPNRKIHSVYFDTYDLKSLRENINGEENRCKYRIRYYNGNVDDARSEIKIKNGFLCYKLILDKTFDTIQKNFDELIQQANVLFSNISGLRLYPISYIVYDREYYTNIKDIRLTLDKNIYSIKLKNNFCRSKKYSNYNVMEFKYIKEYDDHFRSSIFPTFSNLNIRMTKSSKYMKSLV